MWHCGSPRGHLQKEGALPNTPSFSDYGRSNSEDACSQKGLGLREGARVEHQWGKYPFDAKISEGAGLRLLQSQAWQVPHRGGSGTRIKTIIDAKLIIEMYSLFQAIEI